MRDEMEQILYQGILVDKRERNEALEELLKELHQRKLDREAGTRLMIVGSEDDDREFTEMVEQRMNLPATFVIEDHCVGSRYFWNEVISEEDKLMALSRRYLDRAPRPSKDWPMRQRFAFIFDLIKEYKVEFDVTVPVGQDASRSFLRNDGRTCSGGRNRGHGLDTSTVRSW